MKKTFIITFCSLLIGLGTHNSIAQKIGVGIKGGLTFSGTTGDFSSLSSSGRSINVESVTGYSFGAYSYVKFNSVFALQAEINYAQLGYRVNTSLTTQSNGVALKQTAMGEVIFNYVHIPLLLRAEKEFSKFKVWANGGGYLGLSMGGKSKSSINTSGAVNNKLTSEADLKSGDDIKSLDFGLLGGIGLGYKVGIGYVTLDARAILGLTRTPPDTVQTTGGINPDDIKNRSFMLSLGYLVEF